MFFNKVKSIQTKELEHVLQTEKANLIDVREPYEFESGHISGAKNVPLGTINQYKPQGLTVVICQSGMRSMRACKMLKRNGYDVVNVSFGMSAWRGTLKRGKY
jgi:rhodanese-related sulfurtransferase